MLISDIMMQMILKSNGNQEDIIHFMKVYTYAKTIGEQENLSSSQQEILEISAIIHDIACPLCREKYGNANGKLQEKRVRFWFVSFSHPFHFRKVMPTELPIWSAITIRLTELTDRIIRFSLKPIIWSTRRKTVIRKKIFRICGIPSFKQKRAKFCSNPYFSCRSKTHFCT